MLVRRKLFIIALFTTGVLISFGMPDMNHLLRTKPTRLANHIFTYLKEKKTKPAWFEEVERNLQERGITCKDVLGTNRLRIKLDTHVGFQEKPKLRTGKRWAGERREQHRRWMRKYSENIKRKIKDS